LLLEYSQLKPLIVKDKRLKPLHYVQSLTTWQADRKEGQQQKKYLAFQPENVFYFHTKQKDKIFRDFFCDRFVIGDRFKTKEVF
jgi:hypothetical protein